MGLFIIENVDTAGAAMHNRPVQCTVLRWTCKRKASATLLVIGIDWLSEPKYYATFDPIWGSIGPTGKKLWVKMIFVILICF